MGRIENVIVFEDTEKICKENEKLKESVKKSTEGQKLILEGTELPLVDKKRYDSQAKVVVSKKRTYEAASGYKGTKTAVHNFASASNPGGGVERGANAQEECLCRCSGLFFCLNTCQTADYLRRFPQIISDGNTCHILRLMMRMHIISGQTADYRGLISVQLWLD